MSFDEHTVVTRIETLTIRQLRHWVREGWVRPAQGQSGPIFDELDLARLRLLCELQQDMALPTSAMPTVLTLIDHLNRTRRDLRRLTEALSDQPTEIREAIITTYHQKSGAR